MVTKFRAFKNDSQSVGLGELTLENQGDQVNLYGSATFTIDKESLALAKDLQSVINDIISYLEQHQAGERSDTQTQAEVQGQVTTVNNPFL